MINFDMRDARNGCMYHSTHARRAISALKKRYRRRARRVDAHNLRTMKDLPPTRGMSSWDVY